MTHARVIPILAIVSLVTGACAGEPDAVNPGTERNPVPSCHWTPTTTRCETARG
jgi:hypothetical protein